MHIKRAPPTKIIFSFDERKRIAAFISLLITADKQTKRKKSMIKKNQKTKHKNIGLHLAGLVLY